MFAVETSRDFLTKLEADFADYQKDPGSGRLALNCAMSAYHLHEWVWGDWLKKDEATRQALGIGKNKDEFANWIDRACPWFPVTQALTNGAKHFTRNLSFQALRVSAPPLILDMPGAGLDEGFLDGPMPYVTDGPEFLIFDFGPAAAEHRWLPAGMLLEVVVRFWREFFERYGPSQTLQSSTVSTASEAKT